MATLEGMDPVEVRRMGNTMQREAERIENHLIPSVNKLVGQIPGLWRGADATKFQGWWQTHRRELSAAAKELHGLGQSALNNATEQDKASGVKGHLGGRGSSSGSTGGAGGTTGGGTAPTRRPPAGSGGSTGSGPSAAQSGGPPATHNADILKAVKSVPEPSNGGECAIFAENVIRRSTGVSVTLGDDISLYQQHWSQYANEVPKADLQPGDIVQFYNPGGKYPIHTAIITAGDSPANATVMDSNYVAHHTVGSGTLEGRASTYDGHYKVWRIK